MSTRLERFRRVMNLLDPAASPLRAVDRRLYVPGVKKPPSIKIRGRLELKPSSSHLLIGGIGSGKTTELAVAVHELRDVDDTWARYIDVSKRHELSAMAPGVLIVIAGCVLGQLVKKTMSGEANAAVQKFRKWADGETYYQQIEPDYDGPDHDYDPSEEGDFETVTISPILRPPGRPLSHQIQAKQEELKKIFAEIRKEHSHVVLMFDSLDRLEDASVFANVVNEDIRAIKETGIGIAIAGPLHSLYGTNRSITDHFDYFYHKSAVEVLQDPEGVAFLMEVLRTRDPEGILSDEVCEMLARYSGGVLRDLILLAQASVEEAYLSGATAVGKGHAERAADDLGRKYMIGLTSDQIEVLQKVRADGTFVLTSDQDMALLVTRRVLEFSATARFGVHPAIEPLLRQLDGRKL